MGWIGPFKPLMRHLMNVFLGQDRRVVVMYSNFKAQRDGVLVEIGGEVRARGRRPDGRPWRVALDPPLRGAALRVLEPGDHAIATSGTDRNAFEADGRLQSHIIDPRTKKPVDTEWITVIAPDAITSDALATAFAVRGPMNLPGVETR